MDDTGTGEGRASPTAGGPARVPDSAPRPWVHAWSDRGGPLHVVDFGGPGPAAAPAAPPRLLIHGLDGSAANWVDVGPRWARRGATVALDLPGFGRSPLEGRATTMRAYARLAARVARDRWDAAPVLVGNSMGAVVALLAARELSEIAGVALVAPALPREGRLPVDPSWTPALLACAVPGLMALEPRRRRRGGPERQVRSLLDLCYAPGNRESPAAFREMVDVAAGRDRGDHVRAWTGAARSLFAWLARRRRFHGRVAVDAPVWLVSGAADPVIPARSVRAALDAHPDWIHRELPGVGHVPQLEAPGRLAAALGPLLDVAGA